MEPHLVIIWRYSYGEPHLVIIWRYKYRHIHVYCDYMEIFIWRTTSRDYMEI